MRMLRAYHALKQADAELKAAMEWWPLYDGPVPGASNLYQKALDLAGSNATLEHKARLGLGKCFGTTGWIRPEDYDRAFLELRRAYELQPNDNETKYCFAISCYVTKKESEAPFPEKSAEFKVLESIVRPGKAKEAEEKAGKTEEKEPPSSWWEKIKEYLVD